MKIEAVIKKTTEEKITVNVTFPLYLKNIQTDDFYKVFIPEVSDSKMYPFKSLMICKRYNQIFESNINESEIGKMVNQYEAAELDEFVETFQSILASLQSQIMQKV